jgi:hypothetical protein
MAQLAIPERAVLVHIGPPKTGTTSLQAALRRERASLGEHGVLYPGRTQRQRREVDGLLGRTDLSGATAPYAAWTRLVEEVRAAPDTRVCISSESLARARPDHIKQVVEDLGPDRVHMVVTARRLDRLLPSAWQQRVKGAYETLSYGEWLAEVLGETPRDGAHATFWRHHSLAATLAEWQEFLSPDRISVIVADESDRSHLLRVFEGMLVLPEGLLVSAEENTSRNTSLSHERAEMLRRAGLALADRDASPARRAAFLREVERALLQSAREPSERPLPQLPDWAAQRVAAISRREVEELRSSGVRVVGDPAVLVLEPTGHEEQLPPDPSQVPIGVAVDVLAAVFPDGSPAPSAKRVRSSRAKRVRQPDPLATTASAQLLGEVVRRQWRRVRPARRTGAGAG